MKYFNETLVTWGDLTPEKQEAMIDSVSETILDIVDEEKLGRIVGADEDKPSRINPDNALQWAYETAERILERAFYHWVKTDLPDSL